MTIIVSIYGHPCECRLLQRHLAGTIDVERISDGKCFRVSGLSATVTITHEDIMREPLESFRLWLATWWDSRNAEQCRILASERLAQWVADGAIFSADDLSSLVQGGVINQ